MQQRGEVVGGDRAVVLVSDEPDADAAGGAEQVTMPGPVDLFGGGGRVPRGAVQPADQRTSQQLSRVRAVGAPDLNVADAVMNLVAASRLDHAGDVAAPVAGAVGIFGHRNMRRLNWLGVSRCRLIKIDGLDLHVEELDAVDGTPVLDIKPWFAEFGPRGEIREPPWSHDMLQLSFADPQP